MRLLSVLLQSQVRCVGTVYEIGWFLCTSSDGPLMDCWCGVYRIHLVHLPSSLHSRILPCMPRAPWKSTPGRSAVHRSGGNISTCPCMIEPHSYPHSWTHSLTVPPFTLTFHPHHAATVGGASGWHIGKARGVPPGSNAAMLAATSAAAAAAFFVTQRQIARQGRAARGTDGSGSPTAPRIGMGDPRQQQVMATMAGGGAAGAVFGAGAVRTRAAIGTCMVTGAVVGCSAEILRAQYMSWRLGQLLEERHPDIFDGSISAEDMANAAERSGFWPEWAPIQNTATPTREAILNKQIEDLKVEIMEVEDQIEVLQRDR
eukprot:m.112082 g.112082  ORF g.112082 m.112082 type:complete len:316 (-) comp21403_c0_seq1:486-1433(-)